MVLSLPYDPIRPQELVGITQSFPESFCSSLSKGSCDLAGPLLVQLDRGGSNIAVCSSNWEVQQHKGALPQSQSFLA